MKDKESLFNDNTRLVYHIYNTRVKSYVSISDKADYIQEGMLGLHKAVETFNPFRNIKFSTYAGKCILNQMLMYKRRNIKHQAHSKSIYDIVPNTDNIQYLELLICNNNKNTTEYVHTLEAFKKMYGRQTKNRKKILRLTIAGYKQKEIAEIMSYNKTSVSLALSQMKKELKDLLKEE